MAFSAARTVALKLHTPREKSMYCRRIIGGFALPYRFFSDAADGYYP